MNTPLISIGMSVYNCESTVKHTLCSVLNQTYDNWELLVFDDGSDDHTVAVVRQFRDKRIKVFADKQNKGLACRLNQAVKESRGDFFARVDGDDIIYPERFEKQLEYLKENPDVDLVGSRVLVFNEQGHSVGSYPFRKTHEDICSRFWAGFYLPHPTWMGRIKWFQANPYREDMKKAQDQELLLRTFRYSRFACLSDVLTGYRMSCLSLKTILTGRYYFSRALMINERSRGGLWPMVYICQQMMKGAVDIVAVTTGLNYKILKHRAIQPARAEEDQWRIVWDGCSSDKGIN
ncbi:glycosyltransferase family 2 protein [Desulfobacula sp.]|uniref:glycosyltransferase family 2 protein n=1 Tax=Desulfobacula sp. TaxID=2593537 RepID=UPI00260292E8|nr:glycosyltransferase family 2 protein [Desulfobacula sp.]